MRRILGVALVGAIILVPTAAPASAAQVNAICGGTATVTYSPGLRLVRQNSTATVKSIYAPCISQSAPQVVSATADYSIPLTGRSCLDILTPGAAAFPITWNTGQASTFSFNRTITAVAGSTVVTLTGAITSGLFVGATAVQTLVYPALNPLSCLTPGGLTQQIGVIALTISTP